MVRPDGKGIPLSDESMTRVSFSTCQFFNSSKSNPMPWSSLDMVVYWAKNKDIQFITDALFLARNLAIKIY